ncbi:threonine ammonia-lyase [Parvularcula oceani]|uniref:threonine ammonia-lyase n=1 Tax=Parvularcula oceani TaxID=1247963 RepID=UPI0004E13934|nr:threonine/serine dehydratase [Parvularcula oceani]
MVAVSDVDAAAERLSGRVLPTPLLHSPRLDERFGGKVLFKAECLQLTGSFKIRGALNAILCLTEEERAGGVVAYSSGNHAQAVAYAAKLTGLPAVIVMPKDAPETKRRRTAEYGAEVVLYDRETESREEMGAEIAAERRAALIPPYDHPATIAGQGTIGLEAAAQARAMGLALDQAVICCSGGGLASGIALALEREAPGCAILTAEPEGFDDTRRSLEAGERRENMPGARSICDALLIRTPGELTFPILKARGARGVTVSDAEALAAMRLGLEELRVVLEPGGAAAFAALLNGQVETPGRTTLVTLSGGNVDAERLESALGAA